MKFSYTHYEIQFVYLAIFARYAAGWAQSQEENDSE